MSDIAKRLMDYDNCTESDIDEAAVRIAELESELAIYKRRWETVERLAESRGFTDQEWVILFKTGGKDFAQAVDAAGKEGE